MRQRLRRRGNSTRLGRKTRESLTIFSSILSAGAERLFPRFAMLTIATSVSQRPGRICRTSSLKCSDCLQTSKTAATCGARFRILRETCAYGGLLCADGSASCKKRSLLRPRTRWLWRELCSGNCANSHSATRRWARSRPRCRRSRSLTSSSPRTSTTLSRRNKRRGTQRKPRASGMKDGEFAGVSAYSSEIERENAEELLRNGFAPAVKAARK